MLRNVVVINNAAVCLLKKGGFHQATEFLNDCLLLLRDYTSETKNQPCQQVDQIMKVSTSQLFLTPPMSALDDICKSIEIMVTSTLVESVTKAVKQMPMPSSHNLNCILIDSLDFLDQEQELQETVFISAVVLYNFASAYLCRSKMATSISTRNNLMNKSHNLLLAAQAAIESNSTGQIDFYTDSIMLHMETIVLRCLITTLTPEIILSMEFHRKLQSIQSQILDLNIFDQIFGCSRAAAAA